MNISIPILICSLFYIVVIAVQYFLKKHLNLVENKIYGSMIIIAIIGIILDLIGIYSHLNLPETSVFRYIIVELYYIYLLAYVMLFSLYIMVSILNSKNYKNKIKIYVNCYVCIFVLLSIVSIIMPFDYYNNGNIVYVYGMNSIFLYALSFSFLFISIIAIFKNVKYLTNIKYLPMLMLILLGIPVVMIQMLMPEFLIVTSLLSGITCLMYFTLENPDMKMLEEFHKQRELANESNEKKTSFLFNMTNSIKTPIEKISINSEEALLKNDLSEVKNDLRNIKKESNELLSMVNNVLDISDIEKRKISIKGSRYHVYNLFISINKSFRQILDEKIEYAFNYDKSIPEYLYGDSIRLKQVMNILLENASKYTKSGYIEVDVNAINKNDICRLIITIEDTGIGMSNEELENIFDKSKIYSDEVLKIVDDTKNNLGVAKSLVDLMNGNITVKSVLGIGTKFTITIDQKIEEEKTEIEETVEQYEEMYENKKRTILVFNDGKLSKNLKKYLKKYDLDITEVKGGQECLELARKNKKYDLVIIEENLEKLSSEDTVKKLKDTNSYKARVVIVTDKKEIGIKERMQEIGFDDCIFKPFKKDQIEEVMDKIKED